MTGQPHDSHRAECAYLLMIYNKLCVSLAAVDTPLYIFTLAVYYTMLFCYMHMQHHLVAGH